jgi:hypothetical protein
VFSSTYFSTAPDYIPHPAYPLFSLLSKSTLEAVLRSLRRLPWDEDKALHAFMVDTLSNPHALTHQNQACER